MARTKGVCIDCGACVIHDDEAQTFGHAAPECAAFAARHASADETRVVRTEAVGAHLDAFARRVQAKKK